MAINKELLKGSTSLLILSLLKKKPMYGYELIKDMEIRSKGVFNFKEGTLYPILHGLEHKKFVNSFWQQGENQRKRKYYEITKKGLKSLEEKEEEWNVFSSTVNQVIAGGNDNG